MLRPADSIWGLVRRYVYGKRYRAGWSPYLTEFLAQSEARVIRESLRRGVCPFCGKQFKPARGVVVHSVRKHMYSMHKLELKTLVDQLTLEYLKRRGKA